ncbi:MAG TPA: hypothetical protein VK826_21035 [Bacteroidia bacterium]|nr:hypothetical protein [Bacteroidia bacterium]
MEPQYPNPQSFITPPERPRRKIRPWMWIVGGVLIFLGLLVALAINVGQKFGEQMHQGMDKIHQQEDSIQKVRDAEKMTLYDSVLTTTNPDSAYVTIQECVKRLRENSDLIREIFQSARDSFAASLPDTSGLTMLNTNLSREYFITSGRAKRLRVALEMYEQNALNDRPTEIAADSLTVFAIDKVLSKTAPSVFKKMFNWENMNFNQPPTHVFMSIKLIKTQIDSFELALLEAYTSIPVSSMPADSTGI